MRADTITLAVGDAASAQSLHEMLAVALRFPDYYGKNWDAFWDCITDPDQSDMPRRLIVSGFNMLQQRLPREAELLRRCLIERQHEKPTFEVLFENA
jgi:ribonuclease inhibitor